MIDSVLNLIFRCSHRRLTRPVAPITKPGQPPSESYVVCLDCGKQFEYDAKEMRLGKAIRKPRDSVVVPQEVTPPRKTKLKLTLLATLPAAFFLGAFLKGRRKNSNGPDHPHP